MRILHIAFATLCAWPLLISPVISQETGFETEDEINMQNCFETVNDINGDPQGEGPLALTTCIGTASNACMDESTNNQTTVGMVNCTVRETAWWDALLNHYYSSLRENMGAEEFAKLRDSQRLWLSFKDADCAFEYFYWREGTIRSIYGASCDLQHTAERAIALSGYLEWTNL